MENQKSTETTDIVLIYFYHSFFFLMFKYV